MSIVAALVAYIGLIKKWKKVTNIGLIAITSFLFSIILGYYGNNVEEKKLEKGNELIEKIEKYHLEKNEYPRKITELDLANEFNEFHYSCDSSKNEYYVSYSIDGWSRNWYSSKNKEWRITD